MKKIFCALFLALVCFGHVWAGGSSSQTRKYGKLTVSPKDPAQGLVYMIAKTGSPSPTTLTNYKSSTTVTHSHEDYSSAGEVDYYVYTIAKRGYCFSKWNHQTKSPKTSTITNNNGYGDMIRFGATSTDQNNPSTASITFEFKADAQYTMSLNKSNHGTVQATIKYYDVSNSSGTYKLSSTSKQISIASSSANDKIDETVYGADKITLTATVNDDACTFVEWQAIDANNNVTTVGSNPSIEVTVNKNITYNAVIKSAEDDATFRIGTANSSGVVTWLSGTNAFYGDLQSALDGAVANSQNTVMLLKDYTVPSTQQTYTIPSGITLLVPFKENQNVYTKKPRMSHYKDLLGNEQLGVTSMQTDVAKVFRTLTVPADVTLDVQGAISLSGERWFTSGSGDYGNYLPSVSGDNRIRREYGMINLEKDGKIIIEDNGALYCWGRIRGEGKITAKNGSKVYESFVYTDHREYDAYVIIMQYSKSYIINQYYIQDIQSEITYEYGSTGILTSGMFISASDPIEFGSIQLVGKENTISLFTLNESGSSLMKRYDVKSDRLIFNLEKASFNKINMKVKGTTFSTSENFLTVTNNWTINVNSGTCYIPYDLSFAAGAELNIKEGATVEVKSNASLYLYDGRDWGGFACTKKMIPLFLPEYELANKATSYAGVTITNDKWGEVKYDAIRRSDVDLPNAKITVNGTLKINGGRNAIMYSSTGGSSTVQSGLYTTNDDSKTHGASIVSDGNGQIIYAAGSGDQTSMPQICGAGRGKDANNSGLNGSAGITSQITYVPINPAKLQQGNGDYYSTSGYSGNTTFKYFGTGTTGKWGKVSTVTFIDDDATIQSTQLAEGEAITTPADLAKDGYNFLGWGEVAATMGATDVTYNAVWEKQIVSLDIETEQVVTNGDTENPEDLTNHTYTVEENIAAQMVVVNQGSTLQIEESNQVTATTLVLKTTPSAMDNLENDCKAGASSQIKGEGTLNATNVYIDITMDPSGKLDGSKYYAFAVPFNVNINGGVQMFKNNTWVTCAHDTHYRAYTYDGKNRAENGKGGNWVKVDNNGTFVPGVFYLVEFADGSCNTFRFTKASGDLNNAAIINLAENGNNIPDSPDAGWNGIANNSLQNATIELSGEGMAQVFDPAQSKFIQVDLSQTTFAIGTPLFVQVGGANWTANNSAVTQNPSPAPSRMLAQNMVETYGKYIVRIKAEGAAKMADQMFISASENAQTNYVIGKDMVKMFLGNSTVAQLWVNDYGKKLSANQTVLTNDVAVASLTLYAPAAGNYIVYLKDIPENATIYLLQNGQAVANLNNGAFTVALAKGENAQYGLRINAMRTLPGVVTSIDEALIKGDLQKVLLNGVVYIVRDGKLYNVLGQQR